MNIMKEYRQVLVAVELVEPGRPEWRPAFDPQLSNPIQDVEVLLWSRKEVGSKQQSVPVSTHLSHTTVTSIIKCERYISLQRSVFVRSLKFLNNIFIMFRLVFVLRLIYACDYTTSVNEKVTNKAPNILSFNSSAFWRHEIYLHKLNLII